jgi:hypothetical protein
MPKDSLEGGHLPVGRERAGHTAWWVAGAVSFVVLGVWNLLRLDSLLVWVLILPLLAAYVVTAAIAVSRIRNGEYDRQPLPPSPAEVR